jgi:ketosteroid isomerase-like protein
VPEVKTLILIAVLSCAGTSAAYAQEDAGSAAESKIVAMERMWVQAYASKDPKALERILDDTFVNVNADGNLQSKADVLAEVRKSTEQFVMESMVVHLHGDTAIVTGVFLVKEAERGKLSAWRERFVDTWVYKGGQWVSIAGVVTRSGQ